MPVFIPDTHALLWFLAGSTRLSTKANDIFREERAKSVSMYVPAIVVAEIIWVIRAGRVQVDLQQLLATIHTHYTVTPFTIDDAMQLAAFPDSLTIHDAMIILEAKKRNATIITRDEAITNAQIVPVVW